MRPEVRDDTPFVAAMTLAFCVSHHMCSCNFSSGCCHPPSVLRDLCAGGAEDIKASAEARNWH